MEENNKTRYSDEELEEFRVIINEMLDKARAEYNTLREAMTHAGGNDILDTAPTFKTVEDDGAFQLSKEANLINYLLCSFTYCEFFSCSNIYMAISYFLLVWIKSILEINIQQDMHTCICHILAPKKLT